MTHAVTVQLADPTNYGNKPGDGPLHPGGQPGQPILTQDLPSTRSKASKAQMPALDIVRDLQAGAEQVRNRATVYLPQAPGETATNYQIRLTRSVFHNFLRRTAEGLTGLVFRKDPVLGEDVPPQVVEQWENVDNAGTHGDVFCRDLFEDAILAGHNAIFVEYPNTGGQTLTLAQENGLRPYWIPIQKENILSWRSAVDGGALVLTQIVLLEESMVPAGEYGEMKQTRYRVLRRDTSGGAPVVSFQLLEVTKNNEIVVIDEGLYTTQTEIPIAEVTTTGRYGLFESIPPLLDLAYLNVAHYQQWSDYATSIHMTCVPILFAAGVSQSGEALTVGPNAGVSSSDPAAKLEYISHDGQALNACKQALDDLKSDMGTLGLAMLAPQKRSAETAEAKRLDKATSDSALSVAARGLQDAVERALQFHANYLRLPDGGSITINRDFEGLVMEAPVMTAYAQLVNAGFPARLVLEMLQQGGRLPEDADLDEVELEMAAEMAAEAERERAEREERLEVMNGGQAEEPVAVGNPYKVVKRGNKWAVVKADTGELVKAHSSKDKALAHFKALEANVTD